MGPEAFSAHVCWQTLSLLNEAITPSCLTCSRLGPRQRGTSHSRGSRLSGKWAGGPGQGWGGQAQLQGWLRWERDLLIQPSPIEHKAAWAEDELIKKTRGSYLPVGTCSLCRQLSLYTDPQTWLWTWGRSCAAGISVLTCQGNPSPAPAKAVCAGAKVWRNGEGWRGARGRARDAGSWKDN